MALQQQPPPKKPPRGPIVTPLTTLLGIEHPIVLAGMAGVSGGALAAAVSNAGGLGVIGGFQYTPAQLRAIVGELKAALRDPALPFGVDLALPQVGGGARKTNHDYTGGKLDELIDITIESGARLFVSAVGVPPKRVVDRLHAAGVLVMNMVGHPRHAAKALDLGVDMVCAQGGEGGGHTGAIATSILVPAVADVAARYRPALLGGEAPALVLAAGGIGDGRGLAAGLMLGAAGAWVGTRFVASAEGAGSDAHKASVVGCGFEETERTLVVSGRPLRVRTNAYITAWHARPARIRELCAAGVVPLDHDLDAGEDVDFPHIMGQVAGAITDVKPAADIVREMVDGAVAMLRRGHGYLSPAAAGDVAAPPSSKL
ncbi:2-nitropropane dioxygenase [Durotheca rogersii]|uniref:2-nitropropane dioxygenase n=1 Tax=Durotheca rogersii TaxID=419775 RepID=UPI00221F8244|nr:2-nitropropane dioxygenase [Durotheca rogersii]KAI5867224.1 2-nitropropane dioxygenase [Durotheca rogersii]